MARVAHRDSRLGGAGGAGADRLSPGRDRRALCVSRNGDRHDVPATLVSGRRAAAVAPVRRRDRRGCGATADGNRGLALGRAAHACGRDSECQRDRVAAFFGRLVRGAARGTAGRGRRAGGVPGQDQRADSAAGGAQPVDRRGARRRRSTLRVAREYRAAVDLDDECAGEFRVRQRPLGRVYRPRSRGVARRRLGRSAASA